MATKPHVVSLSTTQAGSFPIRAPLTRDDDSSDFEFNGHDKTDNSDTSSSIYYGSEFEECVSDEEFESASEKLFVADPDEENLGESKIFRPSVANPDEESSVISVFDDEGSGVIEEYGLLADSGTPNIPRVTPVAQLSMDDDEFEEVMCFEGMVNDELVYNSFSGNAKLPSIGILDRIDSAPRVKLSDVEEHKEVGLLVQGDSSVVNDSQFSVMRHNEDFVGKLADVDNGILSSGNDKVVVKDDCHVILLKAHVGSFLENKVVLVENSEMNEYVKHAVDGNVSVELVEEHGHAPEAYVDSLVDSSVLEKNSDLNCDPKNFLQEKLSFDNLWQETKALNGGDSDHAKSMRNDFMNFVSEQCGGSMQKKQISEVVDVCDDAHGGESYQVGNILLELEDMKVDGIVLLKEQLAKTVNSSNNPNIVLEPQELKVEAVGLGTEKVKNFKHNDERSTVGGFVTLVEGSGAEKLEDITGQESGIICESLAPEDAIQVVSVDNAVKIDGIQTMDLLENTDMHEKFIGDRLELQSNTKSFGIIDEFKKSLPSSSDQVANDFHNDLQIVDGSRAFYAGSGSSFDTSTCASQSVMVNEREEEKKIFEKLQHIRVKFLRLVCRLGISPEDSIVAQVLYRLVLDAGIHVRHKFSNESANRMALQLEAEGKDDLDFSLNILVIGKTGVGKSATINSIFGEMKVMINAFEPATSKVKQIVGTIDGVRIRILDTPGLRTSVKEETTNRKILASIKNLTKKFPPDVVLYVDRLDTHGGNLNDLALLASISNTLTPSIWQNAIVTLTHAAAPPPEESSGSSSSFEMFVAQRSQVVQQSISRAVGDNLHLICPSMMHPISLVENHPLCRKNERGESVLPNGQTWRSQLLLLCYSLKILSEANIKTKPGDHFDKLPLPNLVSSLLQSRPHPSVTAEQEDGGPETVPVLMPDFAIRPSFCSASTCYRYRTLEPSSQLLVRPILEPQGWDHDIGYKGINLGKDLLVASLGLSLMGWKGGDLSTMANLPLQFSIGRYSKLAIQFQAGINSKQNGQITIKTSSSSQLLAAFISIIPIVISILKST